MNPECLKDVATNPGSMREGSNRRRDRIDRGGGGIYLVRWRGWKVSCSTAMDGDRSRWGNMTVGGYRFLRLPRAVRRTGPGFLLGFGSRTGRESIGSLETRRYRAEPISLHGYWADHASTFRNSYTRKVFGGNLSV